MSRVSSGRYFLILDNVKITKMGDQYVVLRFLHGLLIHLKVLGLSSSTFWKVSYFLSMSSIREVTVISIEMRPNMSEEEGNIHCSQVHLFVVVAIKKNKKMIRIIPLY